jgi:hypothetical protein
VISASPARFANGFPLGVAYRLPLFTSMRGIFPRLSFSTPCARRSGSREHSRLPVAISGLNLLDWGLYGLSRDEGAVKIPGWVAHVQGIRGSSGDAYACERSGRSRCIDLRERQERTRNRDRNRPVLQHPKIANSTTRLPDGAVERARLGCRDRRANSTICPEEAAAFSRAEDAKSISIWGSTPTGGSTPPGRSTPPGTR